MNSNNLNNEQNNINNMNNFNNVNNLMNQLSMLSNQLNNNQQQINNNQQEINNNQQEINNKPNNLYIGNLRRVNRLNRQSKKLINIDNPFKIKLKLHQEVLLYRVLELDDKASKTQMPFGIMSDKPGSGKTFVILAMIYYSIKFFNSKGANIIVIPHNIYTQWISAIDNFLGKTLKYICLIEYNEINQLYTNSSILYNYDIIITTPVMYDIFAGTINSLGLYVRRIFFDEADTMKNILTNSINSQMTWFISASISSVFDPISMKAKIGKYELYLPNLLTNECWCESEFIDSNIKLPKPNYEKFVCKDFYIDFIIVNILDLENLKYINGLDYSNIRQECGGNLIKTNQEIVKLLYLYSNKMISDSDAILKDLEKNRVEAPDTKAKTIRKKQIYTQRQEKIKFLARKYNLCIECFDYIEQLLCKKSLCNDIICDNCWNLKYEKNKSQICLTCNKIHTKETWEDVKIHHDNNIKKFISKSKSKYNKFFVLDNILEVCGKKVIVYSEFRGLNNYLKNYSIDMSIKFEELNGGNIKEIDKILISFKDNDDVKILLIDNAYFGVGLNIEYTTDIIFFHNVDEKIKTQLIGRAQRFGRKSKLNIWEIKHLNEDSKSYESIKNQKNLKSEESNETEETNETEESNETEE